MDRKGFGIIGTGAIAELHAVAIAHMTGGFLVGCYDVVEEKAKRFSDKYRCRYYRSLETFLADPDLEIVTIAVPSGLHKDLAVASAQAGKQVIVEKPLEVTSKRCDAIIEAARENGVLLASVFPSRFHRSSQLVKRAVDEGRLGKLVLCDAYVKWYRTQEYYDASGWRGTWKLDGGGALMNQAIHAIDLLSWFSGGAKEVLSFCDTLAHRNVEVEDTAVACLRMNNGALGVIEGTTGAYPGMYKRIELSGTKGTVVLEEDRIAIWKFDEMTAEDERICKEFSVQTKTGGGASDPNSIEYFGHQRQFENMVAAIEGKEPLLVDGNEAKKAVALIEAIYRAGHAETAQRVRS